MGAVFARRSIRKYTDQPVTDDALRVLLAAAMAAPSAGDERPWYFVVIRNKRIRDQIPEIHPCAHMVRQAPVAILVCGDRGRQKHKGFWSQDCAAATEKILIEAQQLGLGAVWLGVYPVRGVAEGLSRLLRIPEHIMPFSLVVLGHPAEHKEPADRFDDSRIHWGRWRRTAVKTEAADSGVRRDAWETDR